MAIYQPQYKTPLQGLVEGVSKGYEEGFVKPEEERRKYKLELAMKSSLIEQENQNRMQQMAQQNQLEQVSGPQAEASLGVLGKTLTSQQRAAFEPGLNKGVLGGIMSGTAKEQSANLRNGRVSTRIVFKGNQSFIQKRDQAGNLVGEETIGINPSFQKEAAKVDADFGSVEPILNRLSSAVEKFNSPDFLQRLPNGIKTTLDTLIQNGDPEAIALINASDAFALWLTASDSGKQMTKDERDAIKKLIPTALDALPYAKEKISLLDDRVSGKRNAAYRAFIGSEPPARNKTKKGTAVVSDQAKEYMKTMGY